MNRSPEFHCDTLANGLRVITVETPHLHSAEMMCYITVGSRYEMPELSGISHFLEHMLFRGTAEYPSSIELEQAFEAIGGTINASTDPETTCYHSRLHPGQIGTGAKLFASMLRRPLFLEIETERRIILEEALEDLNEKGVDVNPENLTARLLWPGHPLSLPTIGSRASIARIGQPELESYHRRHYTPASTVIAVAGPVCRNEVLAAVEASFADWQGEPAPGPLPAPVFPCGAPESVWVRDSDSQVNLQFAFRLPGRRAGGSIPLRLIRRILSGGGTSRLMLRLRETLGLTYHVEANLALLDDTGALGIDLCVAPENLLPAAVEVLAILSELRREPATPGELERVVRGFLFDLQFSLDSADDLAGRYGWGEAVGFVRTLEDDRTEAQATGADELWRTARELLQPQQLKLAVVGPFRSGDRRELQRKLKEWEG